MANMKNGQYIIEKYINCLLLFLAVFIPSRNVLELFLGTYVKSIPDILILGLAFLYFVYVKGRIKIKLYDVFIIVFLGVAFVNTIVFQQIDLYVYIFEIRSIMVYYALFFVIRNFEFKEDKMLLFAKVLRIVTYVLFVFGLIEKLGNKNILFPASVAESIIYADNYARVHSLFFNPNTYGAFLVLTFFIVIHYEKDKKLILYKMITMISLLLSMSRSSIIILGMGLIAYGLVFKRKELFKKELILQVVVIACVSLIAYAACEKATEYIQYAKELKALEEAELEENVAETNTDKKTSNNKNTANVPKHKTTTVYDRMNDLKGEEILVQSNADGRLYFVKTGLKVFKDYPILGTGFGTYGSAASMGWEPPLYEEYGLPYGFYSDNEYIKDLVETGIIGVLLLIAFCVSILYSYRKNIFSIFFCIIIGWFGLFYNVLEVQIVAFLFWSILGVTNDEKNRITGTKNGTI